MIRLITKYRVIHSVVSKVNVNRKNIKYFFHDISLFIVKFGRWLYVWNTTSFKWPLLFWDNFRTLFEIYWAIILSQSHLRTKERTKQWIFLVVKASLQLLESNTTILLINTPTECEMCFIAAENFVRKIAVHRDGRCSSRFW